MNRTRVLLAEVNEITWDLLDPLMAQGKLPTFSWLKREGCWAAPMSVDLPPQLDPWVTWTTLYTGRPQSEHQVFFLEQPPETIGAPRIWEICHAAGLRVGVYGSLCSWPPQRVNGFYVPDTFAPDPSTYPNSLEAIQVLNLTYTRSIRLPADHDSVWFKGKLAAKLLGLGLSAGTMAAIVRQIARERRNPEVRWQRVALQPRVNVDFFSRLYRQHRPDFASFHTNHVAHYQHTYWKAMQPEAFPQPTTPEEIRVYGGAVEYGYRTADQLLGKLLQGLQPDTVLVVASSMGQKPYVSRAPGGKPICQIRSLERLLEILGVQGRARAISMMSNQFNVYADSPEIRDAVAKALGAAYVQTPERPMFHVETLEKSLTVTLLAYADLPEEATCTFPHREAENTFRHRDLVHSTGMVKSGWHDPRGMMLLYGPGIRKGGCIAECDNLDIAPTLLTLLGLPVPAEMKGRVLYEGFVEAPSPMKSPSAV